MAIQIPLGPMPELAPSLPAEPRQARFPSYGRYLEDFVPGEVFVHPRGLTLNVGLIRAFAGTFMQMNPLYINADVAAAHGFPALPASPQLVFNVVLSLGVQNDSEKAMANLGYYNAQFFEPVYPGDTLRALTRVVSRKERGEGKPGIVHIQTIGLNQHGRNVLQYERKIMVPPRGGAAGTAPPKATKTKAEFPWAEGRSAELPIRAAGYDGTLTGPTTYFEDFCAGDIVVHGNARTITEEHVPWTYLVGNTHPLHYDRLYSKALSGPMSGEPIVYGGLVFAWLEGLASRDCTENALWELGFTEGYHTQPAFAGDTVAAISRVLKCEALPGVHAGAVTFQLIGVKNITAKQALAEYGADLFLKENDKKDLGKEKIPAKIFEIERRVLIKKRPA